MTDRNAIEIGNVIFEQIRSTVPSSYIMSWGAESWTALDSDEGFGLHFKVNGLLHKGFVEIILDRGSDSYTINLLTRTGDIANRVENVYVFELGDVLDKLIETGDMSKDEYKKQVKDWLDGK